MEFKAVTKNTGVSARKIRLYVNIARGKQVDTALRDLTFAPSSHARLVAKAVASAAANAENNYTRDREGLFVSKIYADEAPTAKRSRPRSRGRATSILKRSSHITVIVEDRGA